MADEAPDTLHLGVRFESRGTARSRRLEAACVRVQNNGDKNVYGLHVHFLQPRSPSTDALVRLLRFHRHYGCAFFKSVSGCHCIEVDEAFDVTTFAEALERAIGAYEEATEHFRLCSVGFRPRRTEQVTNVAKSALKLVNDLIGFGHLLTPPSWYPADLTHQHTDGHTGRQFVEVGRAKDDHFEYVLTYLDTGVRQGFITHYFERTLFLDQWRFDLLDLNVCRSCQWRLRTDDHGTTTTCHWRGVDRHSGFRDTLDENRRALDAHPTHFLPGMNALRDLRDHLSVPGFRPRFYVPHATSQGGDNQSNDPSTERIQGEIKSPAGYGYDVAISVAGAQRPLARQLAEILLRGGVRVYYDEHSPEELWGKDLPAELDEIYRIRAKWCVIFVSKEYNEGMWTQHERRSAIARLLAERGSEYILPIQVDEQKLSGIAPTLCHLPIPSIPSKESPISPSKRSGVHNLATVKQLTKASSSVSLH